MLELMDRLLDLATDSVGVSLVIVVFSFGATFIAGMLMGWRLRDILDKASTELARKIATTNRAGAEQPREGGEA